MGATPVGQLDKQLEALLSRLRAAEGDPVSFDELRAQGIENPALLAYELSVAGVQVGRVPRRRQTDSPPTALQLERDPAEDTQQMAATELPDHPVARLRAGLESFRLLLSDTRDEAIELSANAAAVLRSLKGNRPETRPGVPPPPADDRERIAWYGHHRARVAAIAALAIVCLAALALVLANLPATGANRHASTTAQHTKLRAQAPPRGQARATAGSSASPSAVRPAATSSQTSSGAPSAGTTSSQPPQASQSAPAQPASANAIAAGSPESAAALQSQGHQSLAEGNYPQAISQLRAAVAASGESVARCVEPSSEACLTYAYAMYDLGRALRLDGQTASALAVLGERLQIDNQRSVVEGEIALARGASASLGAGTQTPREFTPSAPPDKHGVGRRGHEGNRWGQPNWRVRRTGGAPASG